MIFKCDQCNAQYKISDEKVGKHGVKVRCKKCEHINVVRPAKLKAGKDPTDSEQESLDGFKDDGQEAAENAEAIRTRDALDLDDEELGSALDSLLSFEEETETNMQEDADEYEQSTRVFTHEELLAVHEEREKAAKEKAEQEGEDDSSQPLEWYAAVNDRQIGPIRIGELTERFEQGELRVETLVWKSGFSDWTPLGEVSELDNIVKSGRQASTDSTGDYQNGAEGSEPSIVLSGVDGEYMSSEGDDDIWFQDTDPSQESDVSSAYGQMSAEWKPSAFSNLSELAKEELADLKANLESESADSLLDDGSPFGSDDDEVRGADGDEDSIVGQIAAEEQAAAKRLEEEKIEETRRQEEARLRKKAEEEKRRLAEQAEIEKQAALLKEKEAYLEQSQIPATPTKSGLPKWAVGAIVGCVAVILALSMFIVYRLGKESTVDTTSPEGINGKVGPVAAKMQASAESTTPPSPQSDEISGQPDVEKSASNKPPSDADNTSQAMTEKAAVAVATRFDAKADAKVERKPDRKREPETQARNRQENRKNPARREKPRERATPEPIPKQEFVKPVRKKSSSDILDFEDEKAFADATGQRNTAAVQPSRPKPVKKELPPLSQGDIMEVMRGRLAEFKACTRMQKERDASVRGKMVVTFVIENNGRVSSSKVTTPSFQNSFFGGCITKIISQLTFPESGGKPKSVPFPFTIK